MNCSVCGKPLPPGVTYCPNCGSPTPAFYNAGDAIPNAPTMESSGSVPPPPPPYTNYGAGTYSGPTNPYTPPPPNPYESYSMLPSSPSLPPAPTPPVRRRGNRIWVMIGVVLLALVVIAGSVLALRPRSGGTTGTSSSTPTLAPSQLTATAQANASATANAALTATADANASATASVIAANPDPYTPGGKLTIYDPMSNNTLGNDWDVGTNSNGDGACTFTGGSYQASTPKTQFFYFCSDNASSFSNFAFEVQMKILKGDCGGLVFRANTTTGKLYLFEICQDGSYDLFVYRDFNGNSTNLANGSSPVIHQGLNQSNSIAVVAQGSSLALYVNQQKVQSVIEKSYTQGAIGMVADAYNNPTQVAFNNARLWTL